jgi:tetratricopeptide (TPR) repeat protein
MCLSFWGSAVGQEEIRLVVRPNPEDKHAGPEELAEVARAQGLNALVRVDGTSEMLRQLLSGGVPVMVSTWHEDDPGDGMGHYRLIVGYDDGIESWLLYDSLAATASDRNAPYEPLRLSYDEFAPLWEVFNRRYLVVYSDDLESVVRAVVGEDIDDRTMWEGALVRARSEIAENDVNPFAWFNLGSDLVALSRFEEAASAYDHARQLGLPWRMLWYQFGPFPAYYQVGRYEEVLALANATLAVTKDIEELHFWRGMALAALGDTEEARASLERALDLKPGYPEALAALEGLG